MICDYCGENFVVTTKGSGGHNRKFCYICLPAECTREQRNTIRNRLLLKKNAEYKLQLGCQRCGYKICAGALEWHHPNDDKDLHPSATLTRSWEAYLKETEKCVLLCANCHREAHERL